MSEKKTVMQQAELRSTVDTLVATYKAWQEKKQAPPGMSAEMSHHLNAKVQEGRTLSTLWLGLDYANKGIFTKFSTKREDLTLLLQFLCTYVNAFTFRDLSWPQPADFQKWPYVDFVLWLHNLKIEEWNSVMSWWAQKQKESEEELDKDE
jgi:hypothetical protein